jgi:nicotinamide riboside transporter PnuC
MSTPAEFMQLAGSWLAGRTLLDWAEIFFVVMSIIGQHYNSARRRVGFWFWLAGNVTAVPVWVLAGRYPTALLYVYFSYKCIVGLVVWRRLDDGENVPACERSAAPAIARMPSQA